MLKNILFDMGGVIFLQDTAEAFRRFRDVGVDPDAYMGDYGQKDFFLDVETGNIDADTFCKRLAMASGRDSVSYEEAQYCWMGFIKEVAQDRLDYLVELRQKYHLCLLTNTNPFIMDYTRNSRFSESGHPISYYFDSLFCSYEIKRYKPNADFFTYAFHADNMKAEECVFLDDSIKNIRAAESLGIIGLHVAPNEDWRDNLSKILHDCDGNVL
ncbi:MAG: HAD family hydrolase [Candidatus Limimorpha sp.]